MNTPTKAFAQSALILGGILLFAAMLTHIVPTGTYQRELLDGREQIVPGSFTYTQGSGGFAWWLVPLAPILVLGSPDGLTALVIAAFILMVGGAFSILQNAGVLQAAIQQLVKRFANRKYSLLWGISLFFMLLGAFFGLFEEVVPLIPISIALAYALGWDSLTGLGMSILATNLGFSAAISNPFTIGIAQKLAGLPLFSGFGLRAVIFTVVYLLLMIFLTRHARKIERNPQASPLYEADRARREADGGRGVVALPESNAASLRAALTWFLVSLVLVLALLLSAPWVAGLVDVSLPLVGVLFLVGGIGAGIRAGHSWRTVMGWLAHGAVGIAPGILLIFMAVSVKYVIVEGQILDTLLFWASQSLVNLPPASAALLIYFLALGLEFFISSGSAKAFLLMPILLPFADLMNVTRQTMVLAYCFGDGFSNLAYPTSAVLWIALGLTPVSYTRWLRWTAGLWAALIVVSLAFVWLAAQIGYGPF